MSFMLEFILPKLAEATLHCLLKTNIEENERALVRIDNKGRMKVLSTDDVDSLKFFKPTFNTAST